MKFILPFILFFSGTLYFSVSQADEQLTADINAMREVYLDAADGNTRKVRKVIKHIQRMEEKYRNHPLVLAYKGGALTLRGIDASGRPLDRMRKTNEGLTVVDNALRKLSEYKGYFVEVIETQLVAAYVFINLPDDTFHRFNEGENIVNELLAHPRFDEAPKGLQAAIYFSAAVTAEKKKDDGQYKHYLELTVKTDAEGRNGKNAQILLDNIAR